MMRVLTMAALLGLAGCGSNEPVADNAANTAETAPPGPSLGGVALDQPIRATDPALSWALEIAPGSITFTRFAGEGGEAGVTDFYPVSPQVDRDRAVYATKDPTGARVTITLLRARCEEQGEPEIARPLTAEIRRGDTLLKGCAGPRPADGLDTPPGNMQEGNAQ